MPHKAFGIEWPLFRESKEYQEEKKTKARLALQSAPSNTRSKVVSFDRVYAPTKTPLGRRPLYLIYAGAIVDAILELYPGASNNLYSQIVTQWSNPDCQAVIKQFKAALDKHHTIRPAFFIKMMSANPGGNGWKQQVSLMCDFVRKCCNRPSLLKMGKVAIQFETSPFLAVALILRTIGEHLKLSFDDWNTYRGEAKGAEGRRKHSRKWDKTVKAFKQKGFELIYGKNIRDTARLWVHARILRPSVKTIDVFAAENGLSKKNLLDRLDPFDKAMGYYRHPG